MKKLILEFKGKHPKIDPTAFIVENAMVIGDVEIGSGSNVWFYSIIRGDLNYIRIGSNCNIQDACILHVDKDFYPLVIKDGVILGHRVVVHGCRVGKGSLIGIGAILLNGCEIGEESIVGAGSVVTPQMKIPPRTLALGIPAKPIRTLDEKDFEMIRDTLSDYQTLKEVYQSLSTQRSIRI